MSTSVAVVIPTRNRADLAVEAVRSLLAVDHPRLRHVIVSNNSSDPAHVQQLEQFCARSDDARLLHMRPPTSLAMADHWDWAVEEALLRSDATHLALHYDRRISPPEFGQLLDHAARWPELAITYLLDVVFPSDERYHVYQMPWSGAVYEIRTERAVHLASRGLLTSVWQLFPVLVNCVVPRAAIERVRRRFGSVCASTSPESCFGFRFSALEERYLHFDRALGIHYAMARSNGMGYLRNDASGTFADFVRLFGDRPWLDAAPLPGVSLGQNSFYHEYGMVRREVGEETFPAIDMPGYLNDLARGLPWIGDPARREEMRKLLAEHGWRGDESPDAPPAAAGLRQQLARLATDALPLLSRLSAAGFGREEKALRHARRYRRAPVAQNDFLTPLQPRPVA